MGIILVLLLVFIVWIEVRFLRGKFSKIDNLVLGFELRRLRSLKELHERCPEIYKNWSENSHDEVDIEIDSQIQSGYANPGLLLLVIERQNSKTK